MNLNRQELCPTIHTRALLAALLTRVHFCKTGLARETDAHTWNGRTFLDITNDVVGGRGTLELHEIVKRGASSLTGHYYFSLETKCCCF